MADAKREGGGRGEMGFKKGPLVSESLPEPFSSEAAASQSAGKQSDSAFTFLHIINHSSTPIQLTCTNIGSNLCNAKENQILMT